MPLDHKAYKPEAITVIAAIKGAAAVTAAPIPATKGAAIASAAAPAAYMAGIATAVKAVPKATIATCTSGGIQFIIASLMPPFCRFSAKRLSHSPIELNSSCKLSASAIARPACEATCPKPSIRLDQVPSIVPLCCSIMPP